MKKTILTISFITLSFSLAQAQVGIGNSLPQATLDVTGTPGDPLKFDGIIAPRITGAQLRAKTYAAAQNGTTVYVTTADTAPAGQTIDVVAEGYYYFSSTSNKWVKMGAGSQTSDWHVTGNTDAEISTAAETLGSAPASTNYLGTVGASDNLVIVSANKTHAVLNNTGTLTGGGEATSSFSWGNTNTVSTKNNAAVGRSNTASGQSAIALGDGSSATGDYSVAIGQNASAGSTKAMSLGYEATALGSFTILPNSVSGSYGMGIGFGNTVSGNKNFTFGLRNVLSGTNTGIDFTGGTFVVGSDNNVPSQNTYVFGNRNTTSLASMVLGSNNGSSAVPIKNGLTVGDSNSANDGGYIFGSGNSITSASIASAMIIGFSGSLTSSNINLYSNNNHNFLNSSTVSSSNVRVGINADASTNTSSSNNSDLIIGKGIRLGTLGKVPMGTGGVPTNTTTYPCDANNVGTLIYGESPNLASPTAGHISACVRTGASAFTWVKLN